MTIPAKDQGGDDARNDAARSPTDADALRPRQAQSAAYIADLTHELAQLARTAKLDMLASLLEIARLEARNVAGQAGRRPRA